MLWFSYELASMYVCVLTLLFVMYIDPPCPCDGCTLASCLDRHNKPLYCSHTYIQAYVQHKQTSLFFLSRDVSSYYLLLVLFCHRFSWRIYLSTTWMLYPENQVHFGPKCSNPRLPFTQYGTTTRWRQFTPGTK